MNAIHPQYVVDEKGRPRSVLLKVAEFEELVACVEDVLDAREMERLTSEPNVTWAQVKAERNSRRRK